MPFNRRVSAAAAAWILLSAAFGVPASGRAADTKTITIGMDFALTGAEAEEATIELDGALLVIEETNAKHTVAGYELRTVVLNDATATAGGYDPAQAATSGAGGKGIADAFQAATGEKGMKVLGRDTLDSKASDYTPILTSVKSLRPDLLEYGGITLAGVKLAKQAYDILPNTTLRADASGIYEGDFLKGAGFPAAEGWYATSAAPHIFDTPTGQAWQQRYIQRWNKQPSDYALTTYDAAVVVVDAIARVEKSGQPLDRTNARAAIQATNIETLQGPISFDKNGDLQHPLISIFRVTHNTGYPEADLRQFKYVGTTAP